MERAHQEQPQGTGFDFDRPFRQLEALSLASYRQAGFYLARGFLPATEITALIGEVGRVAELDPFPDNFDVYYETCTDSGRTIIRQIENFCASETFLLEFANGGLRHVASEFLGSEAVLFKDKINYKHPGGGGYPAHRDGTFWWRCPMTGELRRGWEHYANEFVSAAVFLDEANLSNGCLEIVPGRHQRTGADREFHELTMDEAHLMQFEPVTAAPGDVLFMNALAPHRSGKNVSGVSRRVIYLTYNRLEEGDHRDAYFRDKRLSLAAQGGAKANK